MDNYIAAKSRIFENQGSEDYLVLNGDDDTTIQSKAGQALFAYFISAGQKA
jgi:UDP-N-acetylmuramoylalanine-D-glutamate ligase